jgi:hypothetical protein
MFSPTGQAGSKENDMPDEPLFIRVGESGKGKRKPGIAISMKIILTLMVIGLAVFGLVAYGLWRLAEMLDKGQVATLLVLAVLSMPVNFFLGYWFGRTEVRGFLSGVDTAVDKIARAVDLRDGAKVSVHQKIQPPPQQAEQPLVYPPDRSSLPRLSFRNSSSDQVIDL